MAAPQPRTDCSPDAPRAATAARRDVDGKSGIRVDRVSHVFVTPAGAPVLAVRDVSINIRPGEFVSIVGPSGCGKTTIMNMIAGLVAPSSGSVQLHGVECRAPRRDVGYMFARDALIPWRSAMRNVEFGLEIRGVDFRRRRKEALALLQQVGLAGFAAAYPKELSQGMRQRLAVARTLAINPEIILLDEPFAALDAETRVKLQTEFSALWDRMGKTVLLVTHDLHEAVALSDRVLVMSSRPGRIKAEIVVPFARPRDIANIRFTDAFHAVAESVWRELRTEFAG